MVAQVSKWLVSDIVPRHLLHICHLLQSLANFQQEQSLNIQDKYEYEARGMEEQLYIVHNGNGRAWQRLAWQSANSEEVPTAEFLT